LLQNNYFSNNTNKLAARLFSTSKGSCDAED